MIVLGGADTPQRHHVNRLLVAVDSFGLLTRASQVASTRPRSTRTCQLFQDDHFRFMLLFLLHHLLSLCVAMEVAGLREELHGLSFDLSLSSPRLYHPPVQLELLPLHPSSYRASPSSSTSPSWQHQQRFIDVNQIPSAPDCDNVRESSLGIFSSPCHGESFHKVDSGVGYKRQREKLSDSDYERERAYEVTSRVVSDEDEVGQPRKKLRLSKEQSALLEESFKEHSTLNPKQKNALAKQLNLRPRQVEVWFQNRRARTKLKQTEVDCELLKKCCESLTEENRRLQRELQELRAIKVASPCVIAPDLYMPLPATTLSMCPSCERLASTDKRALGAISKPQLQQFFQPSAAC